MLKQPEAFDEIKKTTVGLKLPERCQIQIANLNLQKKTPGLLPEVEFS